MVWRALRSFAIAALLASGGAHAASLEFTPTRVEIGPGQTATTIELQNRGATAAVQVRPYAWTQRGDADELTPTAEIVVSPPIFTVPEGDTQVVRLLLRATSGNSERAYRLIFDELPRIGPGQQIILALRTSVPVFAVPSGGTTPEHLRWTAERGTGGPVLTVQNTGGRAVRVRTVSVDLPGDKKSTATSMGKDPNVLPGATRHWLSRDWSGLAPGSVLTLHVATSDGPREETVTLPR
jgi:fimbrial chaperone protein